MAPVNLEPDSPFELNLEGPAELPPDGTESNFDDPWNMNGVVLGLLWSALVITSIVSGIRVYSRMILRRVTVSDVLGALAYCLFVGLVFVVFKHVQSFGLFIHVWDIRLKELSAINQLFFAGLNLYLGIVLLIRAAILLDWASIFVPQGTRNPFFWASHAILIIHCIYFFSMIVVELADCSSFERNWNKLVPGKCIDISGASLSISMVNLIFDLIVFFLSQRIIWRLQMRKRNKIGVSALFAIGILVCIAASLRFTASFEFYQSRDTTYSFSKVALGSLGETTCGFIVFCGLAVPKAVEHFSLKILPSLRARVTIPLTWRGRSRYHRASSVC